jgi:hypothetical protein
MEHEKENPMAKLIYLTPKDLARFLSKIAPPNERGCRLWTGCIHTKGQACEYGGFYCEGGARRAHCIAYQLAKGPIPEGLKVLHTCDVPLCVTEEHLYVGTLAQNVADMIARGRFVASVGVDNGRAKLTEAEVREIRRRRSSGELLRDCAALFGVSKSLISQITRGKRWTHV